MNTYRYVFYLKAVNGIQFMPKFKIHLPRLDKTIETEGNKTLLSLLHQNDIPLASSCNGDAVCGWCKVQIIRGLESLHPPTNRELHLKKRHLFKDNERLACQTQAEQELSITTTYW